MGTMVLNKLDNDLLRYHTSQLEFANRKEFAGISTLFQDYAPRELATVIKAAHREFQNTQSEEALGFLLCFFFRVSAERFCFLSFDNRQKGIWIDIEHGQLCWNRSTLIDTRKQESIVKIPLPIEVTNAILSKLKPGVAHLGEIFQTPLVDLKSKIRRFSWRISESTHKPYLTRLYRA